MDRTKIMIPATICLIVLCLGLMTVPAFAKKAAGPDALNGYTKSKTHHLMLYEKDPGDWSIVEGGAWGKLSWKDAAANSRPLTFVFNGHGLEADTAYTLIYYGDESNNDVWPYATCIASGTADMYGDVHLSGTLPGIAVDAEPNKIWLVLSSDVNCMSDVMTGWNPTEYLFEYNVIPYVPGP